MRGVSSELIVQHAPRPYSLVSHRERQRLAIAVQPRVGDQIELLKQPQRPKCLDIGTDLRRRRALLNCNYGCTLPPYLACQIFLPQFTATSVNANPRSYARQRLSRPVIFAYA